MLPVFGALTGAPETGEKAGGALVPMAVEAAVPLTEEDQVAPAVPLGIVRRRRRPKKRTRGRATPIRPAETKRFGGADLLFLFILNCI